MLSHSSHFQLLGAAFRTAQCSWLTVEQRVNVENCIKTLSEVAKSRVIAMPSDLDVQVRQDFVIFDFMTRHFCVSLDHVLSQMIIAFFTLSGVYDVQQGPDALPPDDQQVAAGHPQRP